MSGNQNALPGSIDPTQLKPPSSNSAGGSPAEGSEPAAPQKDEEVISKLARLKPLDYERVRAEQANLLGCRPAVLDDLVKAARNESGEAESLPFLEVEPWHEPINPAQLLDEIVDTIRRFIVLDKWQADAVALWVLFTWLIAVVAIAPLLIISAPEKSCGKTQLLALLRRLVLRALVASNMRSATLFRIAEKWHPSILIDEVDSFLKTDEETSGLINAGHTRDSSIAWRLVGDNHEPKSFDVWGAKALAGISLEKHLPDATVSRAIVIELRRKLPHESVSRLRHAEVDLFEDITSKLARFALDYSQQVRLARPTLPDALSDREQDNWEPLLAIAGCAGPEWVQRATEAALKLSDAGEKSVSTGAELLADIREIFKRRRVQKISTADLIEALCEDAEKSWATYSRGKPLSPRQLARLLSGYGIKSKTIRMKYETPKGFDAAQFIDAFARYLAPPVDLPPPSYDAPDSNNDEDFEAEDTDDTKVY